MAHYEIRVCEDPAPYRRQLVEFWQQNLPHGSERRFDWLHYHNPTGAPLTALAFVQGDHRIVGCGSMYPWPCCIGGVDRVLWFSSHFAVATDHRVFGPAFTIQKALVAALADRGESLAFGYPNKVSAGTLKVAGYRHIGASHDWVRILDSREMIRRRLPIPGLGSVGGAAFKLLDAAARSWLRRSCRPCVWEILERCDSRLDELWLQTKESSQFFLARTSAVMNWRYADYPDAVYKFFAIRSESASQDAIDAQLVFTREGNAVVIKDVFPPFPESALPLVMKFLDVMAREQVQSVTVCHWGSVQFRRLLQHLFFFERPTYRDYYVRNASAATRETDTFLTESGEISLFFG